MQQNSEGFGINKFAMVFASLRLSPRERKTSHVLRYSLVNETCRAARTRSSVCARVKAVGPSLLLQASVRVEY